MKIKYNIKDIVYLVDGSVAWATLSRADYDDDIDNFKFAQDFESKWSPIDFDSEKECLAFARSCLNNGKTLYLDHEQSWILCVDLDGMGLSRMYKIKLVREVN